MVGGADAAVKVGGWISSAYVDRLRVEVIWPILHLLGCENYGFCSCLHVIMHN